METRATRARRRIEELGAEQFDLASYWRRVSPVVAEVVPHYWVPCWYTLDPATHLITSHFHDGLDEYPDEWLRAEYLDDDVNQLRDVSRSADGLSTLHELTGGDPSGTPRWRANIELGGDQELLLSLRTRDGEVWGALGLYREQGAPMFDDEEKAFLRSVSRPLAEGARHALVFGEALDPDWPEGPGLVVVAPGGGVVSMTAAGQAWWERIDPVAALAAARAAANGEATETRVRLPDGPWLTVSAARMQGEETIAVLLSRARPARIFDLVMSAHALTPRERDVVALVLEGRPTSGIAAALQMSAHTVQEHLKSVFEKMGVRSRRELVAQAFFTHYAPRFRDNERRTDAGEPLRGNPALPEP